MPRVATDWERVVRKCFEPAPEEVRTQKWFVTGIHHMVDALETMNVNLTNMKFSLEKTRIDSEREISELIKRQRTSDETKELAMKIFANHLVNSHGASGDVMISRSILAARKFMSEWEEEYGGKK